MIVESVLEKDIIKVPNEVLEKIKGKKFIEWKISSNNEIVLKFNEISHKCEKFEKQMDKIEEDMRNGNATEMDMNELADFLGLNK